MNILLRKCWKPIHPSSQLTKRYLHEGKRLVLGIESSCDDSCAALVREDGRILSSVQKGQNTITRQFRGVVPLLASKSHEINLPIVVNQCLNELGKDEILSSIDAVALFVFYFSCWKTLLLGTYHLCSLHFRSTWKFY